MEKTVTTQYTFSEPYKCKTEKHTYDEEINSTITLVNGKFSRVSFSSGSVWSSLLICDPIAFKRFVKVFLKVLKKLDELEIIDITEVCDFLRCQ